MGNSDSSINFQIMIIVRPVLGRALVDISYNCVDSWNLASNIKMRGMGDSGVHSHESTQRDKPRQPITLLGVFVGIQASD
jgi:hypothetical protein